ncbi:hypothetical protein [Mycolicibacterium fortuitum]
MSEPSIPAVRQHPRGNAELADLTLIVRPHCRTFTGAQRDEAAAYAAEHGATVESLPLPMPGA